MTPTEFLQDRNIVAEDKTDLTIGFDNGAKESLIELLDSYHQAKLKLLGLHNVSNCTACNDEINYKGVCEMCYTNL
jgi:hypothetical protein